MLLTITNVIAATCVLLTAAMVFHVERASAQYPSARPNEALREELRGDEDRLFPLTEHFAFGADGEVFHRAIGTEDFYHGIGHWLQVRSEAAPNPFLRVNLRTIIYSGAASNGYSEPQGFYNLFALSAIIPGPGRPGLFRLRLIDLGRQTVGLGLMIQEEEMNGALLAWTNERHTFLVRGEGTGVHTLSDDTYNAEASLYGGYLGGGVVLWPAGVNQDLLLANRASYGYAYSTQDFGYFNYGLEYGQRGGAKAGLLRLGTRAAFSGLRFDGRIEGRRYDDGFGEGFIRNIDHQYVSYDQYDKAFTNPINLFFKDDDVTVLAAHLNFYWDFSHAWRLHSLNEVGRFDFAAEPDDPFYFFRAGVDHCPLAERDDCVTLFVSNKVLSDSFARPPALVSRTNVAFFRQSPYFGISGRFRF